MRRTARLAADADFEWALARRPSRGAGSLSGLCRTPAILDYVEDIAGPDFYQWGGQFFVKYPGDGSIVPWHQDAQYWPLTPRRTVTVWLAIHDADEANAAMQVVAGSHPWVWTRQRAASGW